MAGEYPHVVTDTNVKISLPNTSNLLFPVPISYGSIPYTPLGVGNASFDPTFVDSLF